MIASITYVKEVMGDLKAKKKYGQNFLIDDNIVDKIAMLSCDEELLSIEIGPGLGALTEHLLRYGKAVDAYEIDEDMYERLLQNISDERLRVFHQDFLKADLSCYQEKVCVCGNLPYYVTTPILFKLFESQLDIAKITIMVQKEVGERLGAAVNSADYGALSIEVQYLYDVVKQFNVPRTVFYPQPNVDSMVLSLLPKRKRDRAFEQQLFTLVKNCFRMRRKTLYNNLKDLYDPEMIAEIYAQLSLPENVRAQELTLEDYEAMCRVIYY